MTNLRNRVLRASTWTLLGYGVSQILRFVSNLFLTRLLAPEHFGVMALVNVLLIGINMFTDVGIGPNIIQNKKSNQPVFLNTAWTIQILRGFSIWLFCIAVSWPFSLFYGNEMLILLVPVAGLVAVIGGFNSTNIYTVGRDIDIGRLTILEISAQTGAILFMLALGLMFTSVWILIAGSIASTLIKMIGSHYYLAGIKNEILLDRAVVLDLLTFGKWIFFTTLLSFLINTSGSLVLGRFLPMSELGLFTIATTLAKVIENIYMQLGQKVLLPLYVQIKHLPLSDLRDRVAKIRIAMNVTFLPPLWAIVVYGQEIVNFLFDSRYHGAGWILRVYAAGMIFIVIPGIGPFYLAMGNSSLSLKLEVVRFVFYVIAIMLGWLAWGPNGIIIGMAMHSVAVYFVNVYIQIRYGVFVAKIDFVVLPLSFIVFMIGSGN